MDELSPRQREIAGLVAEGLTVREIAERLVLSEQTVKNHKVMLYAKLGVDNRDDMADVLNRDLPDLVA